MGTNVFSQTVDNPDYLDTRKSLQHGKTRHTIWVDRDKVSISESRWFTGIRYNQTHRWWRWRTTKVYGFMRRGGLPQPFTVRRMDEYKGQGKWINTVPRQPVDLLDNDEPLAEAFKHELGKAFNANTFDAMYPMAGEFGIGKFDGMPLGIRRGFREKSMEDFTAWCFGVKRVALAPVVAATDPYFINLAREYRGFTTDALVADFMRSQRMDDLLETALNNAGMHLPASYLSPRIRKGLRCLEPHEVEALIKEKVNVQVYNNLIRTSHSVNTKHWTPPTKRNPVNSYVTFERSMYS